MENEFQNSRQLQKQKTRTAILSAAAELFKQKGFAKTTLRDVAKNSGVATGTVFTHFEDKLDLLTHILFEELDSCVADAWKALRRKKKDTKLLTQLTFLVRRVFTFYFSDPELSRVLLKEGIFSASSGEDLLGQQVLEFLTEVASLVEDAKQRGEIRKDLDTKVVCQTYFSVYLTTLSKYLKRDRPKVERAAAEFKAVFSEILRWGAV
jgi:AcrR family transcriptional regulator